MNSRLNQDDQDKRINRMRDVDWVKGRLVKTKELTMDNG